MWVAAVFLYLAFLAANTIFVLGATEATRLLRIRLQRVKLGYVKVFQWREIEVGLIPWGAWVRMYDNREHAADIPVENAYDRKPRVVRALAMLSGPLAMLLFGLTLTGEAGLASFAHGFFQVFEGALAPHTTGAGMVLGLLERFATAGVIAAFGTLLLKLAAFNLLPIPTLCGGVALLELFGPSPRLAMREEWREKFQQLGLFVLLPLWGSWLAAFAIAMYQLWVQPGG
jgi:membrane-associated protease RseP (regulator of RpoE activity)